MGGGTSIPSPWAGRQPPRRAGGDQQGETPGVLTLVLSTASGTSFNKYKGEPFSETARHIKSEPRLVFDASLSFARRLQSEPRLVL